MGNECVVQAHNSTAALRNYDKAIALNPYHWDAWVRKGVTLLSENRSEEGEACFTHVILAAPTVFKAWYHRGKIRYQQKRYWEAISDFDKATSLRPDHARSHELYGDVLLQCGKEAEAIRHWNIAEHLRKKIINNKILLQLFW